MAGSTAPLSAKAVITVISGKRPTLLISDIANSIKNGDGDTALNSVIQQYIFDWSLTGTVAEWRISNYAQLRDWAYPPYHNLLAALAKNTQAAIDEYVQDYFDVDNRFLNGPYIENTATTIRSEPYTMVANSVDTFIITDIPIGFIVNVQGPGMYPAPPSNILWSPGAPSGSELGVWWFCFGVGWDEFQFQVDTPGVYTVSIFNFTWYLNKHFVITAGAP